VAKTSGAARSKLIAGMQRWAAEAEKAAACAEEAKQQLRAAKADLKKARKSSKAAKKAAKEARKKVEAAENKIKQVDATAARANPAGAAKPAKASKPASAKRAVKRAGARSVTTSNVAERPKRSRAAAPKSKLAGKTRQSAADVARSVIKRLAVTNRGNGGSERSEAASKTGAGVPGKVAASPAVKDTGPNGAAPAGAPASAS
jgi:colicin import membrane protein